MNLEESISLINAGTNMYKSPNGIYSTLSYDEKEDSSKIVLKEKFGLFYYLKILQR